MITTVTMNPCLDKALTIKEFRYGGLNRVKSSRTDIGGKGINVAVAYTNLGGSALCTGINYERGGDFLCHSLDAMGIQHDFIRVPGELRTNLKLFDESRGVITEVNQPGWPVKDEAFAALKDKVGKLSKNSSLMVFSGSVPEGMGFQTYRELMESCDTAGCRLILDAEGQLLMEGLKAKPYLIKPNRFELEKLLDMELRSYKEIAAAAGKLLDYGVGIICVSLGEDGAVVINQDSAYYAPALPVEVKSTVGAGDSMVAALCLAIEEGRSLDEMLQMAMAAAASSVMAEGTKLCSKVDYLALLHKVRVNKL